MCGSLIACPLCTFFVRLCVRACVCVVVVVGNPASQLHVRHRPPPCSRSRWRAHLFKHQVRVFAACAQYVGRRANKATATAPRHLTARGVAWASLPLSTPDVTADIFAPGSEAAAGILYSAHEYFEVREMHTLAHALPFCGGAT